MRAALWRRVRARTGTSAVARMLDLMSSEQRRRLVFIMPAVTLNAIIQVLGIVSVIPFLALVASPEVINTNDVLRWAYETMGFAGTNTFLVVVGVGVLILLVGSNAFAAWTQYWLLRFAWDVNHSLSVRMLRAYMFKPYVFFLQQNSSGLAKNILGEVRQAVGGYLVAMTNLVARGLVAVCIMALLVVLNPLLALATFGFLGGAYALLYAFISAKLATAGTMRSATDKARYKAASEALTGVKEIKLLGKERPFLKRYMEPSSEYSRHMARQQVISAMPRYAFETVAFGGLLTIILYMLWQEVTMASLLPTLGVYAYASYRLLPSLQGIFEALANMRFSLSAVDLLHHDLQTGATHEAAEERRDAIAPLPFKRALELRDVRFSYPSGGRPVLDGFSLSIPAQTSVALVGPTGSGKTTTIDLLLGLLEPDAGELLVDGVPITTTTVSAWQKNLGYVPQMIYLADDTVRANIAFGVAPHRVDQAAVERAARASKIHDFVVDELPHGYDTVVGERGIRLSGGQRQRLGIARALYHDPGVLVLDEATSALDNVTEAGIFAAVHEIGRSKTVIMIAHRISTVRGCDTIYVLERGRIVASGTYDELMRKSPQFQALAAAPSTANVPA